MVGESMTVFSARSPAQRGLFDVPGFAHVHQQYLKTPTNYRHSLITNDNVNSVRDPQPDSPHVFLFSFHVKVSRKKADIHVISYTRKAVRGYAAFSESTLTIR